MELFVYDNMEVKVNPKALYIAAFKNVWKKYRKKDNALEEFAYIWFAGSHTSDFASILDKEGRRAQVLYSMYAGDKHNLKLDDKTEEAIEKLEELQDTPALSFLNESLAGIDKVKKLIGNTEVHSTKDGDSLLTLITKAPALIRSLMDLKDQIKKESESQKIKGQREKGAFEDAGEEMGDS